MKPETTIQLPSGCYLVELPCIRDERGSLAFGEAGLHIPFVIRRVFWTYGIKGESMRGDHAHRTCQMVLFPIGGSFDIELDDGRSRVLLHMDDASKGIFIPPLVWCRLTNFSACAACISLASEPYEAADYIHSYEEFLKMRNEE